MAVDLTCPECRLMWSEDRPDTDEPGRNQAFECPRCRTHLTATGEPVGEER